MVVAEKATIHALRSLFLAMSAKLTSKLRHWRTTSSVAAPLSFLRENIFDFLERCLTQIVHTTGGTSQSSLMGEIVACDFSKDCQTCLMGQGLLLEQADHGR